MNVGLVVAWVVLAALAALSLSVALGVTGHAAMAVAQDAQIYLLGVAWVIGVVASVTGHWLLAAAAAVLAVHHVALVAPRLTPNRVPRWVATAPRMRVAVVNVFIDNETPAALADVVLAASADVVVIAEWNPAFASAFDAAGGAERFPHRLLDPDDDTDYAVAVLAAEPLAPSSTMVKQGPLAAAQAVVPVGTGRLTLLALNPMAVVDPDGYEVWDAQLRALQHHLRRLPGPVAVAGDLNTTTFRPRMRRLLSFGLRDAHETLGRGLSPSFKLAAQGALAVPGPIVRLDHVLTDEHVRAVELTDLESAGSDHVPFVAELAVRVPRRGRTRPATAPGGTPPAKATRGGGR